jgi:hypothetical protein
VKDENGGLPADSHNILNRWKNYFSLLLNVPVSDTGYIEIHTAEPLTPGPSHFEVEIAIAKLKNYKSPGSDEILLELIQAGSETLLSVIHTLINSIWYKEKLPGQRRASIIVQIHKKCDKTDCNNYCGISLLSTSYNILLSTLFQKLGPYIDEIIGYHQWGF